MTNSYIGNSYYPQPGTIAARAMPIIDALAPGESIPNAVLAERLEQPSNVILASLKAAERYGLVERCSEGGYAVRWRKGDGTPPPATYGDGAEEDTEPPKQSVVKAEPGGVVMAAMLGLLGAPPPVSGDFDDELPPDRIVRQGGVALPDVPRWPGLDAPSEPVQVAKMAHALLDELVSPEGAAAVAVMPPLAPVISPAAPRKGMRVALWSDGTLQIQRSVGDVIVLTVEETRQLVRYLERMAESADA